MVVRVDADGVGEGDGGEVGAVREEGVVDLVEVNGVLFEDLALEIALVSLDTG